MSNMYVEKYMSGLPKHEVEKEVTGNEYTENW